MSMHAWERNESDIYESGSNRRGAVACDDQWYLSSVSAVAPGSLRGQCVTRNAADRGRGLRFGRGWFWRDCHRDRQLVVVGMDRRHERCCRLRCNDRRRERYDAASRDCGTAVHPRGAIARGMVVLTGWSFRRTVVGVTRAVL